MIDVRLDPASGPTLIEHRLAPCLLRMWRGRFCEHRAKLARQSQPCRAIHKALEMMVFARETNRRSSLLRSGDGRPPSPRARPRLRAYPGRSDLHWEARRSFSVRRQGYTGWICRRSRPCDCAWLAGTARERHVCKAEPRTGLTSSRKAKVSHSMNDAFDQWSEWAEKPFSDMATIPADIHTPIMDLLPEDRRDRTKVNEAVRRYQCDRRQGWAPAQVGGPRLDGGIHPGNRQQRQSCVWAPEKNGWCISLSIHDISSRQTIVTATIRASATRYFVIMVTPLCRSGCAQRM